MPTTKTATAAETKAFDFEAMIKTVRTPRVTVSIFTAADLYEQVEKLDSEIAATDDNAQADKLTKQRNTLVRRINASEVKFTLRPTSYSHKAAAQKALVADGILDQEDDRAICYLLAEVTDNGWTGTQMLAFRDAIGEAAFLPLIDALFKVNLAPTQVAERIAAKPAA